MRVVSPALRALVPVGLLGLLLWQLGARPVTQAFAAIDLRVVAAALAIGVVGTVATAWRWTLVSRGLGVELSLRHAVSVYYRSQLLNLLLPFGVLGDLHRGVRHGLASGDTARGFRTVVWDRVGGQVVQAVVALAVLLAVPSPVRPGIPALEAAVVVGVALAGLVVVAVARPPLVARGRVTTVGRVLHGAWGEVRAGLLSRHTRLGVLLASVAALTAHAATFLLAARTAGVHAPTAALVPLAFLALLAMAVPLSLAGWGPREGVAAWSFGAAGLGAAQGLATAVVYGVLVLVASLPGLLVLLPVSRLRTRLQPEAAARG